MKVLLTGASGGVARHLRALLSSVYELRLSDIRRPDELLTGEDFVAADLRDLAALEAAMRGVDGVIHLGGLPVEHEWQDILENNVIGNYHVFEAARRQGVGRVVFASSNQAVGFYPRDRRIGADVTVRPSSRYGLSKAFGEAAGALYADKYGLRVLCIRIGRVSDLPEDERRLSVWLQPGDLAQLCRIGLEHPDLHYEIVYGISDNARAWYDNKRAYELGYRPQGCAEAHVDHAMAAADRSAAHPVARRFMGGNHCAMEYAGDIERTGS